MAKNLSKSEKNYIFSKFENFDKFQMIQYVLVCLPLFTISMTHVNYVFVAENINYRCRVPECENIDARIDKPSWWPSDVDSNCYKPVLFDKARYNKTCSNISFTSVIEECQDWIYENNNSIVAELNLACQPWKINFVGGVHNAGMIVSMFITGWVADRIGRKPTVIICSVGACVGVFKIFTKSYYPYIALEFLESVLGSGLYTVGVVLLIEIGGRTKRVLASVIFAYAVYAGEIFFAILAMTLHYWKWLVLIVYAPMILFILYIFPLKESTRWQMLRGRTDDAKKTLAKIAKMNKIEITETEIADIDDKELRARLNVEEQKDGENIKVIINSRVIMTRLCVTAVCFFTSSFLYYGSIIYAVLLPGNKYTNFILAALTSFPGDLIAYYTINKYGRKITVQCGYVLSAVFLLAQHYCPPSITWLKLCLFMVGKLGMVICFTGTYTYSLELFPSSVRGTLLGCGNTAARIGGMLAPLTPLLITDMPALPSILFSATALISAALVTLTPETKELPMFDTIAQIESWKIKNLPGLNNLPVFENTNNKNDTCKTTIISTKL